MEDYADEVTGNDGADIWLVARRLEGGGLGVKKINSTMARMANNMIEQLDTKRGC